MSLTEENCKSLGVDSSLFMDHDMARAWANGRWSQYQEVGPKSILPIKYSHAAMNWADGYYRGVYLALFELSKFENLFDFSLFCSYCDSIHQEMLQSNDPGSVSLDYFYPRTLEEGVDSFVEGSIRGVNTPYNNIFIGEQIDKLFEFWLGKLNLALGIVLHLLSICILSQILTKKFD